MSTLASINNQPIFAAAIKPIAQSLQAEFPMQTQVAMKYAYTVDIDSRTQLNLFPSDDRNLPLGLTIQSFDASHGLDSEVMVGLFSEWSFALGCMVGILRLHNSQEV